MASISAFWNGSTSSIFSRSSFSLLLLRRLRVEKHIAMVATMMRATTGTAMPMIAPVEMDLDVICWALVIFVGVVVLAASMLRICEGAFSSHMF